MFILYFWLFAVEGEAETLSLFCLLVSGFALRLELLEKLLSYLTLVLRMGVLPRGLKALRVLDLLADVALRLRGVELADLELALRPSSTRLTVAFVNFLG